MEDEDHSVTTAKVMATFEHVGLMHLAFEGLEAN